MSFLPDNFIEGIVAVSTVLATIAATSIATVKRVVQEHRSKEETDRSQALNDLAGVDVVQRWRAHTPNPDDSHEHGRDGLMQLAIRQELAPLASRVANMQATLRDQGRLLAETAELLGLLYAEHDLLEKANRRHSNALATLAKDRADDADTDSTDSTDSTDDTSRH